MKYDGISEFRKAAPKRLADAEELLGMPTTHPNRSDAARRHLCGAWYLAGYAVEFMLKAYIIDRADAYARERVQTWRQVLDQRKACGMAPDLSGARSHNLELLLKATDLEAAMDDDTDLRMA